MMNSLLILYVRNEDHSRAGQSRRDRHTGLALTLRDEVGERKEAEKVQRSEFKVAGGAVPSPLPLPVPWSLAEPVSP